MTGGGLVGRERQLAELDDRLADARDGRGSVVLIEGDAGTGKTALAHEMVWRSRQAGVPSVWGACVEGGGAGPYGPWAQILRSLGQAGSPLVDPGADAPEGRHRLFEGVVQVVRTASAERGMLIVLDDLHHADVPSMRLLNAVAAAVADSPILLLALYRGREAHPFGEWADAEQAMPRGRATVRFTLGGLPPDSIAELATRTLGRRPEDGLLRAVQRRSGGNPLFVVELVRLAEATGTLDGPLPGNIREVIGHRLDRLPKAVREVIRQASVFGRDFTAGMLATVAERDVAHVHDLLDEAAEAGLLVVGGHTMRFDHVLTQEALYGELPVSERRRLHARTAEALRSAGNGTPDLLAHHLRQAAPLGLAEDALAVTCEAAGRARKQLAYEHAAFQYRQALDLLALVPDHASREPGLLLDLARCEFRSGAVDTAWDSCRRAADLARAAGDGATVADAAVVLRGITNSPLTARIHAMCREALAMLGAADRVRRARVLAQLAVTADPFSSGLDGALSRQALAAAEESGDPDARFLAMQARQTETVHIRHAEERLSIGDRSVRLGRESGREEYLAWGLSWRVDALWELGRRVHLDAELATFAGLVEHMKEPLWSWRLVMIRASLACHDGRFADALAFSERALDIGRRGGHETADFLDLVLRAHLAAQTGSGFEAVEPRIRQFVAEGPYLARSWLAHLLVRAGRLEDAAAIWETLVPHVGSFPSNAPEWIVATVGHAEICAALGDRATGARVYADLLPYADRQAIAGAHTPSYGPVALYLGMLASLGEDWEAAEAHLGMSLASCRAMGSEPYEAATRLCIGRMLLERGRPQDLVNATEHIDAASRTARRSGMAPLEAEATALRDKASRSRATVLSGREIQVAALVAEGLSNRQIAHRLHLSERTAENHVAHILTKLGFDSRARIAAWYVARGRED